MIARTETVWTTGGNGFISRYVAAAFAARGFNVIALGRQAAYDAKGWGIRESVVAPSVSAAVARAFEKYGAPDYVFHGAGTPTVHAAERDPEADRAVTIGETTNLLSVLLDKAPDAIFTYPSSCAVYGNATLSPIAESAVISPISAYGHTKAEAEQRCLDAARAGLRVGIIRYFSVYGAGLRKQLLWELAGALIRSGRVDLAGTGDETRDFLHVEDAARLAVLVTDHLRSLVSGSSCVVNGGTGRGTTVREVAALAASQLAPGGHIAFSGIPRPGDPRQLVADIRCATNIGFSAQQDPRGGIRDYFLWAGGAIRSSVVTDQVDREGGSARGFSSGDGGLP